MSRHCDNPCCVSHPMPKRYGSTLKLELHLIGGQHPYLAITEPSSAVTIATLELGQLARMVTAGRRAALRAKRGGK